MQICFIFMFIKLWEGICLLPHAVEFSHTQPYPVIIPNSFIYILVFLYFTPSHSPPLSMGQRILFQWLPKVFKYLESTSCLFKIQTPQEVGPRNQLLKIFTGDSYDHSGLLNPISDYYLERPCMLKDREADILCL